MTFKSKNVNSFSLVFIKGKSAGSLDILGFSVISLFFLYYSSNITFCMPSEFNNSLSGLIFESNILPNILFDPEIWQNKTPDIKSCTTIFKTIIEILKINEDPKFIIDFLDSQGITISKKVFHIILNYLESYQLWPDGTPLNKEDIEEVRKYLEAFFENDDDDDEDKPSGSLYYFLGAFALTAGCLAYFAYKKFFT